MKPNKFAVRECVIGIVLAVAGLAGVMVAMSFIHFSFWLLLIVPALAVGGFTCFIGSKIAILSAERMFYPESQYTGISGTQKD